MDIDSQHFDAESWDQLPNFFDKLPETVRLHIWGDENANPAEQEALRLANTLSNRFGRIEFEQFPRQPGFNRYPTFGVMGVQGKEIEDFGVRIIGLPAGYQITSLIAAIQSVSFRGMTSEAKTRIQLQQLKDPISMELITSADDEVGPIMSHRIFNMAVVNVNIRSYLIMGDAFPESFIRYSINHVPHLVINGKVHIEGVVEEETILKHIARAI